MNRIGITGLGLLIAMAFGTSSVIADGSLLTPTLLGQDGGAIGATRMRYIAGQRFQTQRRLGMLA